MSKARRFFSTAAPFSAMACRIASSVRGRKPRCHAAPKIIMLEKIESPIVALARSEASNKSTRSRSRASSAKASRSLGNANSVSRVKSPVMISWLLTTAPVRPPEVRPSVLAPALTTKSPPINASHSPVATRIALISSGVFARRQWMWTAPPFWASPAISIMPAPLPSICAACAMTAPMVTTPVPPTPVMTTFQVPLIVGRSGIGKSGRSSVAVACFFTCAPSSVTKDGQNPLTQEKSLLQLD
mmetsp:Transcript_29236/g.56597  ORF Transcript_29236/g.56597 Transcript_29236/m.56597 type:complete len:243 (+) Transcript_29236:3052-3780(+)